MLTFNIRRRYDEPRYATSSITSFLPLNSTVSPARAPSIASKIGAIVEIPMTSRPSHVNLLVETAMTKYRPESRTSAPSVTVDFGPKSISLNLSSLSV